MGGVAFFSRGSSDPPPAPASPRRPSAERRPTRHRLLEHLADTLASLPRDAHADRARLGFELAATFRDHVQAEERALFGLHWGRLPCGVARELRTDIEEHQELQRLLEEWIHMPREEGRFRVRGNVLGTLIRRHLERERALAPELERANRPRGTPDEPRGDRWRLLPAWLRWGRAA